MSDQSLYLLTEAAVRTGLTVEAIRQRIKRGKLEAIKGNDGLLRVRLTTSDLEDVNRSKTGHSLPTVTSQPVNDDRLIKALEDAATARGEALVLRERAEKAEARADQAQTEAVAALNRAARAEGEIEGIKLATEHQHEELAQMRREVAEAHNRAVTAEQQVIEATRQREGAEAALARARKWSFLNFLFGREGKGRK